MASYLDEEEDEYDAFAVGRRYEHQRTIGKGNLPMNMFQQVSTKIAPAYDGSTSWFSYEEAIDDWLDITELDKEKQGPALRNRLEGNALQFKRLLDRELLRHPVNGVKYFKDILRTKFVKGLHNVFLYRFLYIVRFNRGNNDMLTWLTKFEISSHRLVESWMDLGPRVDAGDPRVIAHHTQAQQDARNYAANQDPVEEPVSPESMRASMQPTGMFSQ